MSKTIEVPNDLMQESVEIGAEAAILCEKVASDQAAIMAKAPLVADSLIQNNIVDAMDKEATIQLLMDPVTTLDIVARLSKQASPPRSMGRPEKAAQEVYDPRFPPQKESERIFAETLESFGG